ncbi:RING-H2 finger protein ATL65-like [Chenopodium quinoa]|nr:RING-H2 finger protein ATL65-like [Chenopodium quinoa]
MAARPPEPEHPPQPGPTLPPTSFSSAIVVHQSPPSKLPIDFSPPLIAMVVVAAAAFLFITYSRLISRHLFPPFLRFIRRHRRRRILFPPSDIGSPPPPYESSDGFYVYSPYGLDESVIKNIPLTIYKFPTKLGFIEVNGFNDCAVCLLDFEEGECIRTLPLCCHAFHVDCIDMWLRSHATCPLCRAGVYLPPPESPLLSPVMTARIRPSFDEGILLESMFLEPLPEVDVEQNSGEIQEVFSPERRIIQSEDQRCNRRELDFLLKRSYSFGFERSFPSERLVMEPATTPYHHRQRRNFFWTKRPSSTPFSSIAKSRVFSFRRTMKSPALFRRRGFFPLSESSASLRYASTDEPSRRIKSMASPLFGRAAMFSSSRMRSGDPEALISPERFNRR